MTTVVRMCRQCFGPADGTTRFCAHYVHPTAGRVAGPHSFTDGVLDGPVRCPDCGWDDEGLRAASRTMGVIAKAQQADREARLRRLADERGAAAKLYPRAGSIDVSPRRADGGTLPPRS